MIPVGRPAAPGKPAVHALDQRGADRGAGRGSGARVRLPLRMLRRRGTDLAVERRCHRVRRQRRRHRGLANGASYRCRAFAANAAGVSDPSEVSDLVRPCGSVMDCNPIVTPVLGRPRDRVVRRAASPLLASLYRDRTRGYVVAVVDVVHTGNLGYGSKLGIRFVRATPNGVVTGIASDRGRGADFRIRHRGGDRVRADRQDRQTAS